MNSSVPHKSNSDDCQKSFKGECGTQLTAFAHDPRPFGYKQLETDEVFFRVRVGDYRIIYEIINKKLTVLVVRIGHRRDVYR